MKFRKETLRESGAGARREAQMGTDVESSLTSSEEMREVAEAVSLYRSAMHHMAEQPRPRPAEMAKRAASSFRMRLVLVPALGAALAAAVIAPAVSHMRHPGTTAVEHTPAVQAPATDVAKVDDRQLMDQIDSDLQEDVPDALQPLADWGEPAATTNNSVTEKK
ncbi:MAG TPA: hypothetical protein VIY53_12450 [Acidobacteriaceae bacterium]